MSKIVFAVCILLAGLSYAQDIQFNGDIAVTEKNVWGIAYQAKHTASGAYVSVFPGDIVKQTTWCSSFDSFNIENTALGNVNKLECSYTSYTDALDSLISGMHKMADLTETKYSVGFASLSWTMYFRKGTSATGYTYISFPIPADVPVVSGIPTGPSSVSTLGYEVSLDLSINSSDKWLANIQLKMKDKIPDPEDPDKQITQYYYVFPKTDLPTAYCSGDFTGFSWTRQTGDKADSTHDDEFTCIYDTYAEAFLYGLKAIHGFGKALQGGKHLVTLSITSYEMGTVVTSTKQIAVPLMSLTASEGNGNEPEQNGTCQECPEVEECIAGDFTGDKKVDTGDVAGILKMLTD
jgi:hypothetical protein